jgi:hypothetical protein
MPRAIFRKDRAAQAGVEGASTSTGCIKLTRGAYAYKYDPHTEAMRGSR